MDVVVSTCKVRGRHLVATRAFEPGDVVVSQLPYASVLFNEHVQKFCNYCFCYGTDLRRCSRSKFARYCCREHQLLDWKEGYKQECAFLIACAPRLPPATIRLAAQVAWKRKRELEEGSVDAYWNTYAAVESLMDHWEDLDEERMKTFAEMGCFITKICPHLPEALSLNEALPKSFARMFARFAFNNHTVSNSRITSLGCGVYPLLAMANHSSWPNCIQHFEGKKCEFRAIRSIKAGEEITITYVDLMSTSIEASEVLKKDYLFDYLPQMRTKQREKTMRVNDRLEARIWKKGRPGWISADKDERLTCIRDDQEEGQHGLMVLIHEITESQKSNQWAEQDSEEEEDSSKELTLHLTVQLWGDWIRSKGIDPISISKTAAFIQCTLLDAQEAYDHDRFSEAVDQLQSCLKATDTPLFMNYRFGDGHILRLRMMDLMRKATVDAGIDWQLALDSYRQMAPHLNFLFPYFWSERGSQLAALARLEANYGNIKSAFTAAEDAVHVLRVTDGSGDVMQEMKTLMHQLRHEIDLQQQEEIAQKA